MIYNLSIFGDIDISSYGSRQPLWILGVPQVKIMGTFLVIQYIIFSYCIKFELVTNFFLVNPSH